jgi:hypothetical protein
MTKTIKNLELLNQKHKKEPIIIIGAGTSVNDQPLDKLSNGITIAVNSGILAYTEATYWCSDDWEIGKWSFFNELKKLKTIPLLYDKKLGHTAKFFDDRALLFKHRLGWHLSDTYSHSDYKSHICQARTSLITAIAISHIMGCSPIILLGVDCYRRNGKRYFWQEWDNEKQPYRTDGVKTDKFIHKNDTDTDLLDVIKYWNIYGKEISKKCKVLNASQNSKITIFPKINL